MLLRPIPTSFPRSSLLLFPPNLLLPRRRHRRRRRRPPPRSFLVHSSLDNPSSLYLLAPAFSLISAAGAALLLSSYSPPADDGSVAVSSAVGEWLLLASPTPFNRSVFLRCPSIEFEDGGELLDGVSDRLVTESRHYVNLAIGEEDADAEGEEEEEEEVLYQRICVRTKDGGVLSVDWPEHLDLRKEHGLDTTVVVVPGTTQGSMERKVKLFVRDALRHGYFPVVMNPRGCGGSPLTTPRLFTAADSDDISTIVRFLNTMRPWTSLVGVSWGYGSNMLTKYLAEVGDSTPLTAAVCIDNPFDLDEATRSIPLTSSWNQDLLSGLIDIVVANKELFLGKGKGFDVQEALSAATLRDFDEAISMVPHGCDSVEEFYAKISTRRSIENIKTPVLFIENDNGTVPLFSIPRAEISENPFTSLLLCSYLSSGTISSNESAVMWCQQLAIEWLSAVELALLKGRHPLLEDIDISINPSKDFSFVNGRVAKNKPGRKYRESPPLPLNKGPLNGYLIGPPVEVDSSNGKIGKSTEKEAADSLDVKEEELEAGDESQVLQTASVVMNMLDVTMPGTLNDEQKKKVLTAMERGETLMKALQEAVPEDVRGKLTSAATEIIQSQKSNPSLNVLKRVGWTKAPLDAKPKTQDNSAVKENVNRDSEVKDANSPPEQSASPSENSSSAEMGNHEKNSQSSGDVETSSTVLRAQEQQDNSQPLVSNEAGQKPTSDAQPVSTDANTPKDEVKRVDAPPVIEKSAPVSTDTNTPKDEVKKADTPVIEKSPAESQNLESHETVLPQHGGAERQMSDTSKSKDAATIPNNTVVDPNLHNNSSKIEEQPRVAPQPPSINVSQALDALTGFDDSTQMAVNSVFGVIENMIEQLEKKSENNESTTDAKASENAKSQNSEIGEEPKNKVKVAQDEINSSLSSNEVEDDAQMETSTDSILSSPESNSNQQKDRDLSHDNLKQDILKRLSNAQDLYYSMQYAQYFPQNVQKQLESKELDSDSATDLILDPQEGKWKMVNQAQSPDADSETSPQPDNVIEPSYVILESSTNGAPSKQELAAARKQVALFIREELLGALETEVRRKLGVLHLDFEDFDIRLVYDLEELATSVSENVVLKSDLNLELFSRHDIPKGKIGRIESEYLIKTVSCAVHEANHLMTLLPMGLVVGSMLACLRKYLEISELHGNGANKIKEGYVPTCSDSSDGENDIRPKDVYHHEEEENDKDSEPLSTSEEKLTTDSEEKLATDRRQGQGIMVGTVTAAIGASALLVQHQKNEQGGEETPTMSKQKDIISGVQTKLEDETQDKNSNLVSSLAEKAMSVAGPVVPTKSDGEVDHERLVAVLAELGQKGGILRLVGKVALLWGGIRGAMSLTDRLISFLHIGERPLLLRLLGFVCMALLLWSPVVIPLLPTLVRSWSIKASTGIVGYACVVGLYTSLTILVIIWGKRIRGYDDPVAQYGLDLTSTSRVHEFLKGLVGGIMVVFSVHSVNALLGYARFSWPLSVPPISVGTLAVLKAYGNILFLVVRGLLTAIGISMVEELLFRSWLEEEIAVDHGYYQAIVFSGIAFSLIHRSVHAMPGFLIMSILLSGIKQRSMGKLAAPIGLRAGIMSASHILRTGGFISYNPSTPFWLNSSYPLHPFDGAVGLLICLMLAILFFPQKRSQKEGDST